MVTGIVIFSDESKVEIGLDNRVYIWRRADKEWLPACTSPPPRKWLGVMTWGCVTFNGVGTLDFVEVNMNALKYIDILEDNLWPVVARHIPHNNSIFQDDKAPIHRAREVMEYRVKCKITMLSWPAQSPENVENVWQRLKWELQNDATCIATLDDLKVRIRHLWENLPFNYV